MKCKNFFIPAIALLFAACTNSSIEDRDKVHSSNPSGEPSLLVEGDQVYLSWVETSNDTAQLFISHRKLAKWSEPQMIASGTDWFVNWADFPSLYKNGSMMMAHYLEMSAPGTYTYDIKYIFSRDEGKNWSGPYKLNQDTVKAEHGFLTAIAYKSGFYVTWLDGRHTGEPTDGAMSIRAAYIDNNGHVTNSNELDNRTCDCCQTSIILAKGGPVVFYRDRSEDEIRDMSFVKMDTDESWSEPKNLNEDGWQIKGCPVNGPRADASKNKVAVAWFTGVNSQDQVKLKISEDGGITYGKPRIIDAKNALGRVDIKMNNQNIFVSWIGKVDKQYYLRLGTYDLVGNRVEVKNITPIDPGRKTGFPRMGLTSDKLWLTWTEAATNSIQFREIKI